MGRGEVRYECVSRVRYSSLDQIDSSFLKALRLRIYLINGPNCASIALFLAYYNWN
jgi:hypothetical protein